MRQVSSFFFITKLSLSNYLPPFPLSSQICSRLFAHKNPFFILLYDILAASESIPHWNDEKLLQQFTNALRESKAIGKQMDEPPAYANILMCQHIQFLHSFLKGRRSVTKLYLCFFQIWADLIQLQKNTKETIWTNLQFGVICSIKGRGQLYLFH